MTNEQVHQWAREAGIELQQITGITGKTRTTTLGSRPFSEIQHLCTLARADLEAEVVQLSAWVDRLKIENAGLLGKYLADSGALRAEVESLRADAAKVRNDALEEAAMVCEGRDSGQGLQRDVEDAECAIAIRSLK